MIVREAIRTTAQPLKAAGLEDFLLEAELLLRKALVLSRVELYCQLDRNLNDGEWGTLAELLRRRLDGEPAAYITQSREFYGLDFYVDGRVLIPRPETELLVERSIDLAKQLYQGEACPLIADIGTGSGAIAVAVALHLPGTWIYATDISSVALEVARINSQRHKVTDRVIILQGDLLEPLPESVDIIVANLPYVRDSELINAAPELGYEPRVALCGDIMEISRLLTQAHLKLNPGGYLLIEMGEGQEKAIISEVNKHLPGAECKLFADLSGIYRVVQVKA